MTITPQEIQSKQFHVRLRGFDVDEVDKFLEKISEEFLVITVEHKQAFERIDSLEKEIANYRNKEQAFQNAILSAQRISDEMQERSRREAEETLSHARQEAAELTASSREEAETTLLRAGQEAAAIKELAESKSREMVENLGVKIVNLTAEINRLVAIKEGITSDLRRLLEDYLTHLEEGMPAGLQGLQPLPPPEPVLPPEEPAATPATLGAATEMRRQAGLWGAAQPAAPAAAMAETATASDTLDGLYEKIDLTEDLLEPAPMADLGASRNVNEEFAAMDLNDIESLDLEESGPETAEAMPPGDRTDEQSENLAIAGLERDMLFTLEDPLDDLEPSISIRNDDRNRR